MRSKTVSVEAFVRGRTVTATISDAGQWSGDSSASQRSLQRGRGLTMINGLADDVKTIAHRGRHANHADVSSARFFRNPVWSEGVTT